MRRLRAVMVLAAAAALWCAAPLATGRAAPAGVAGAAAAAAAGAAGTWRAAIEVPGTGGLNKGGNAAVQSVSCASAGNCAAGGFYADRFGRNQAFVVSERNGHWRTAIEVPGSGALNARGRCRAPRRATAPPRGATPMARATARRSWPARPTAPGTRRSRCPARPR